MSKAITQTLLATAIAATLPGAAIGAEGDDIGSKRKSAMLEEVTVTAQKRAESLQEVPISVAALSGEGFDSIFSAGEDILALAARVPNLYAESSNGRAAPRFYIRGLGNSDFDLAASQPVSIIFDDVVQENVVLKSFPIFDVEQMEVVRGPQGTLFGRNTTAGVIKFDSRKPTMESDGYINFAAGGLGTTNVEGAFGGALVDGKLAGRVSVLRQERGDWMDNTYTGETDAMGGFTELAMRAQLLWTPSEDFSALLNVHQRDLDGTASIFRANIFEPGKEGELNDNFDRDSVYYDSGDNNPQKYESAGSSLKLEWDLGEALLTSISAYESADGSSKGDIDGGVEGSGPGFIPFSALTEDQADVSQLTQEIRLASNTSDPLQWQLGGFYYDADLDVTSIDGFYGATTVSHGNTSWALFGQTSYDFSEALTGTLGLRYTYDEKSLMVGDQNVDGFAVVIGAASIQDYDPVKIDDDQLSWETSLNYALSDDTSVYVRLSEGFRAQSIQARDVAFEGSPSVADSETITSFELGYKADLLENTLRLNTAVFYYEIDDIQLTAVGGGGNFNRLLNADKGVGKGFEVDLEWVVNENLLLTAGAGFADTEIQDADLTTAPCGSGQCTVTNPLTVDGLAMIDGNPFQSAPESVFNFTLRYSVPVGSDGEAFFYTDWAYQGETHLALYTAKEYTIDNQFEGGLRAGYTSFSGDYELAFFGRNITDEENIKGQIDFNNLTGFVNDPRIFGMEFRKDF
ncbi:TonB-dependent receptor [Microbulbifer bruguierae]|uniref:TonB-dependent receptor n=1 Tax=Microbulbifer bruguierae TaxID=3029061 RepID=A0ABY8NCN3_9GAMM|nr:TonB-dependent receptor [Microbulbifer bruguierae]WGL15183.1 TonB-dependent receptor [Microbulbifer bruguierae]